MPLLLPKTRGGTREANFTGRPSTTWGTVLTSDTTAHTLPATYTELIASTTYDADWVNIWFHTNSAANTNSDSLVNIYVGAGSAEQLLIPNLLAGWVRAFASSPTYPVKYYGFPLFIPAGSRLSARHQSVRVSTGVTCMIELLGGGRNDHWTGTKVEAVGADTANSRGTAVTPGTTAEGTLTSIGTNTYDWGFVQPMMGGNSDTTMNAHIMSVDLSGGSTTANLLPGFDDFLFNCTTSEEAGPLGAAGRYGYVPPSTTLYLRARGSGTAESNDFVIYGVF